METIGSEIYRSHKQPFADELIQIERQTKLLLRNAKNYAKNNNQPYFNVIQHTLSQLESLNKMLTI